MNRRPPWSRMRWHQPARRTVSPMWLARSAPQLWDGYRCMNPLATGQAHARCGLKRQRARQAAADLQTRCMAKMTTAEATVAALLAHGIDTLYALPGVHNDHPFESL